MSEHEANQWILNTMNVNPEGSKNRFDVSTTVSNVLDEVAIFVMGGGGFNVEYGHAIDSTPNCVKRCSVQIIVDLEKSLVQNLRKSDELLYFEEKDYCRRLALENKAIEILRAQHSTAVTTI